MKALGWHFISSDKKLGFGDGRFVDRGRTYEILDPTKTLKCCKYGLHASKLAIDALRYAAGPIVCRVQLHGRVLFGGDKMCASHRTVLAMADASRVLHEYTCRCAEDALALVAEPDPRSVAAIAAKRAWLRGENTDADVDAAYSAAWDVVKKAHCAAVTDSTYCAARDAAYSAAYTASRRGNYSACDGAACDAAYSSGKILAWAAAVNKQNRRLTAMLASLLRDTGKEEVKP